MFKDIRLLVCAVICFQTAAAQVSIDPSKTYQAIEGFSASDCWTGHYVGKYWNEEEKEKIAKFLFGRSIDSNGNPEGIGLSAWRFNLGAGTMEQGDASDIGDISRRAECFLDETGNYDWSKQAGQQWFLKKAREYGCENFTAFSNAPLVAWSKNGKGYSNGDGNANLKDDQYAAFAGYMADVTAHFTDEGIPFKYISPVNEPQWEWKDPAQEGSPWTNNQIKRLVVELDKSIAAKHLPVKILLSEAGEFDCLYVSKGRASNQIKDFFDSGSTNYIGNLPSLSNVIGGHSYWTYDTDNEFQTVRENVKKSAGNYGLGIFQTEWSMLSSGENFPSFENASYMDLALLTAKIIHGDLVFGNVSLWSFWTAMDMERWGHKNRFLLIALSPGGDPYKPITETGTVKDMPTLWALGNYSYFIRPGYKRIKLSGASDLQGLMGSAYISPDNGRIVTVYVNLSNETKKITADFMNTSSKQPKKNCVYVTSSIFNLRKMSNVPEMYNPEYRMQIPSRSIATIIYDFEGVSADELPATVDFRIFPNPVPKGGSVNVFLPNEISGDITFLIYTTDGKPAFSKKLCNSVGTKQVILPSNLEKGVYIVKLRINDEFSKFPGNKLIID
jgi:O-glycosyl hydrolase